MGRLNELQKRHDGLDLVGTFEASLILGVERPRIPRWLKENEDGKNSIPEPMARLKCGPIWARGEIIKKLRLLYAQAGGDKDDEAAFEQWSFRRSLGRAQALGLSKSELMNILRPTPGVH